MALIVGDPPPAAGPGTIGGDNLKIFGYTLQEWNEVLANIKQLLAMRGGASLDRPADPPRLLSDPAAKTRAAGAPPIIQQSESKADIALRQIQSTVKVLVDNGGGDAKLVDILNSSGITVKQLYDALTKALQ